MEQLAIAIPDQIENLSLPNPELLQFYKDVENRIIKGSSEFGSREKLMNLYLNRQS